MGGRTGEKLDAYEEEIRKIGSDNVSYGRFSNGPRFRYFLFLCFLLRVREIVDGIINARGCLKFKTCCMMK